MTAPGAPVILEPSRLQGVAFLVLFLGPLFLQNITFVEVSGAGLKLFHLSTGALALYWLYHLRLNLNLLAPLGLLTLWFVLGVGLSVVYGLSGLLLNYFFILILGLVAATHPGNISPETFRRGLFLLAAPAFLYVLGNILINFRSVIEAQSYNVRFGGRPVIPYMLFSGGWNLEASYLAMLTALFIRQRRFWGFFFVAFLVSLAYLSRTAFVLMILLLAARAVLWARQRVSLAALLLLAPLLALSFGAGLLALAASLELSIIERFRLIGSEPGSLGRLNILAYVVPGLLDSQFLGYGPGNTVDYLRGLGLVMPEDNVHNYFLQVLFDFGVAGLVCFLLFILYFLLNPYLLLEFKLFLGLYLVGSLVQFRGAEPLVWGVLFLAFLVRGSTSPASQRGPTAEPPRALLPCA